MPSPSPRRDSAQIDRETDWPAARNLGSETSRANGAPPEPPTIRWASKLPVAVHGPGNDSSFVDRPRRATQSPGELGNLPEIVRFQPSGLDTWAKKRLTATKS